MGKALFVTGTGTDVGKTYISALLVKKLKEVGTTAGYYKAAVSGNERDEKGRLIPGDATYVKGVSGIDQSVETMCPYVYERAYSPHLAAKIEGNPVDSRVVIEGFQEALETFDYLTMEGSGGILCPLWASEDEVYLLIDLVKELHLPCLVVANAGLGTINDVVLTCDYLKRNGIRVQGIILNHFHPGNEMEEDNRLMCERLSGVPVLACVRDGANELDLEPEVLAGFYL